MQIQPVFTDATRFATGTNAANNLGPGRRQIGLMVPVATFAKIRKKALKDEVSMGEVIRQCIEEVL